MGQACDKPLCVTSLMANTTSPGNALKRPRGSCKKSEGGLLAVGKRELPLQARPCCRHASWVAGLVASSLFASLASVARGAADGQAAPKRAKTRSLISAVSASKRSKDQVEAPAWLCSLQGAGPGRHRPHCAHHAAAGPLHVQVACLRAGGCHVCWRHATHRHQRACRSTGYEALRG